MRHRTRATSPRFIYLDFLSPTQTFTTEVDHGWIASYVGSMSKPGFLSNQMGYILVLI